MEKELAQMNEVRNKVAMFNSLNDFKHDIKQSMMRKLQNATVRNANGFRTNQAIEQNTIFSNSFIRDSVISTLKHNSKDGEDVRKGHGDRYSDVSSEIQHSVTHTLN